jgi:hypothetical protein
MATEVKAEQNIRFTNEITGQVYRYQARTNGEFWMQQAKTALGGGECGANDSAVARTQLAALIEANYRNHSPIKDEASEYYPLLHYAFENVAWVEVADAFLRTVDGYMPPKS